MITQMKKPVYIDKNNYLIYFVSFEIILSLQNKWIVHMRHATCHGSFFLTVEPHQASSWVTLASLVVVGGEDGEQPRF